MAGRDALVLLLDQRSARLPWMMANRKTTGYPSLDIAALAVKEVIVLVGKHLRGSALL